MARGTVLTIHLPVGWHQAHRSCSLYRPSWPHRMKCHRCYPWIHRTPTNDCVWCHSPDLSSWKSYSWPRLLRCLSWVAMYLEKRSDFSFIDSFNFFFCLFTWNYHRGLIFVLFLLLLLFTKSFKAVFCVRLSFSWKF